MPKRNERHSESEGEVTCMNALETRRRKRCCPGIAVLALALACANAVAAEAEKKPQATQADMEQKLEAAQKRLDAAAREVADLSMSLSDHVVPHVRAFTAMGAQRAILGINLGPRADNGLDDGVKVVSVSPGGAAADAGLQANDVLLELNGKSLRRDGDASPREKLLTAMREVKAGDKVSVRYRRDGKVNTASVVAEAPADRLFTMAVPFHGAHGAGFPPHMSFMRAAGVFGSAELVALTPKLGQYFGTDKGLLVVRAPEDSRLKLEEGDVIVDIDGRTPSSASHALRILGSYQAGEKLKLNVLRAKKRMTFDVTVPEDAWEKPIGRTEGSHFIERAGEPAIMSIGPFNAPLPPAPPLIAEPDNPV
jgi:C-terminal processing protease CtpA/Prc